jgi:hypothetical protein
MAQRRRIAIALATLAWLTGCVQQGQDPAEREFNAWANQIERDKAADPANAQTDFDEPSNILERVVPANAQ